MQKRHFEAAAKIVKNILDGLWTYDPPRWADAHSLISLDGDEDVNYTRAVWTAEAFINLFSNDNPRFDTDRFLVACGLAPKRKR